MIKICLFSDQKKVKMKMKEIVGFLLFGLAIKSGESAMMCELQKSKSRYNNNNNNNKMIFRLL